MSSQNLAISPETFPKSSHKTRNVWIGIGVSAIIIVTIILGLTLSKDRTPTPSPVCFLSKLLDVSTDSTGENNHYLSLGVIVPSGIMKKDSFVYITMTSILTSGIQLASRAVANCRCLPVPQRNILVRCDLSASISKTRRVSPPSSPHNTASSLSCCSTQTDYSFLSWASPPHQ